MATRSGDPLASSLISLDIPQNEVEITEQKKACCCSTENKQVPRKKIGAPACAVAELSIRCG